MGGGGCAEDAYQFKCHVFVIVRIVDNLLQIGSDWREGGRRNERKELEKLLTEQVGAIRDPGQRSCCITSHTCTCRYCRLRLTPFDFTY